MRTTVKIQAILLREAREALSLRRNADIYPSIKPIVNAATKFLGGGILSHYRGNSWGITWCGPGARDCFVPFSANDLNLEPSKFVEKILLPKKDWARPEVSGE